jgi:hypothetical protein
LWYICGKSIIICYICQEKKHGGCKPSENNEFDSYIAVLSNTIFCIVAIEEKESTIKKVGKRRAKYPL